MEIRKKCGLVLEGGAYRGMFTCGVLDVMMENGIRVDGAVGVSAGASAPEYIVKEIIEFLQKNGATDIVEVGSDLKEKSFPLPKEVRP